ncbi:MAG: pyridine nucleotide-disulfide oxidoreductase, partial [Pseudomonadales bacterium]|nr:pyridine nucleotide-disulfide oxidoreductase [Pseudomonadales bacterium]
QYNIKLQIAGFNKGYERVVLRGEPSSDSFVAWYMKGNTVLAADCINSSKEFMQAKKLIAQKVEVTDEQLANTEIAVADLVPKPA